MKIHELRFENLNSLYGEWIIDFRHPEYQSHGIFALTGPTGSGKSTILDAVCLSLYGMTPRLGRITKSSNEIISRKTGSCYAELLFETSEGLYRCRWEQRRARKKPEGALQDPDHQIWDEASGTILESKKSLVPTLIEDKTGMDFDRFTRSMLLAQGAFDTFLKADTEEKSKILEQITGTAIYSEISLAVHERRRSEQQKLQLLEHDLSSIALIDDQTRAELEEQLQRASAELEKSLEQEEQMQWATSWRLDLNKRGLEIKKLEQELKIIQEESEAFEPKKTQLQMAQKAVSFEPSYTSYTSLHRQLEQERNHRSETAKARIRQQEERKKIQTDYDNAMQKSNALKEKQKALNPVLSEVMILDERIHSLRKRCEDIENTRKQLSAASGVLESEIKEKTTLKDACESQLKETQAYLDEHAEDEQLVTGFSGITSQLEYLRDLYTSLESDRLRLKQTEAQSQKNEAEHLVCKEKTADVQQSISSAQERQESLRKQLKELLGDRQIREYREQKDALLRQLALHNRIEELEQYRSRLEDGSPCPLCGALDHPYAEGNIPEKDACERQIEQLGALLQEADSLQENISLAQQDLEQIRADLQSHQEREAQALLALQRSQDELTQCRQSVEKDEKKLTSQMLSVQHALSPLGVEKFAPQDADSVIKMLELRLEHWKENQLRKTQLTDTRANVEKSLLQLQNSLTAQQERKIEQELQLKALKGELETIQNERFGLFGDKDPRTEQQRLQDEIDQAEHETAELGKTYAEIQQAAAALEQELKSTDSRIQEYVLQRDRAHEQFISDLQTTGFADEQEYVSARMDPESRKQLEMKDQEIRESLSLKQTLLDDARERYTEIEKQQVTEKSAQELDEASQELKENIEHVRENVLQLKHQLSAHQEALKEHEKKLADLTQQKRECVTWDRLHALIGSADGKKFRNFAQGLTFSIMIGQANRQLELMSDRYLLIKDETHPLELNVIDTYQAGEIRSTKNLSGGESFIVSLSLALGLSAMSGQSVRVDSLFLDEGFGTLDEQALETALETLAVLQQEGKLIGIISHVGALKERISTQITVIPKTGGKSVIQGPGCRSII
jgi:exonuclease SbcC